MVFAVLAVLPDFLTVKVKVQVPLAFTITELAVATQAPLGFAFTPTNFTLVEFAVVTPILLSTVLTENLLIGPVAGGSGAPCYPEIKDRAVLGLVASNFTDLVKTALTTAGYSADEAFTAPRPSLKKGTFSAKTVLKRIGISTSQNNCGSTCYWSCP